MGSGINHKITARHLQDISAATWIALSTHVSRDVTSALAGLLLLRDAIAARKFPIVADSKGLDSLRSFTIVSRFSHSTGVAQRIVSGRRLDFISVASLY